MAVFRAFLNVVKAALFAIFVCVLNVNAFAVSCEDNPLLRDPGYVNMPAEALGIGFEAMCSATIGSRYEHGTPDEEHGQHCWCRVIQCDEYSVGDCSSFDWAWVYVNNFDEMGRECDSEACLETCNELANSGEEGVEVRSSLYSIDCESDTDPEDPQQDGFNIQYDGGGATGGSAPSTPTSCVFGTTCRAPVNTYSRSGYSFTGWHCTVVGGADCSTPVFNDGDDLSRLTGISAGDTITLTAKWTPQYNVTYLCYDANGNETTAAASGSYSPGATVIVPGVLGSGNLCNSGRYSNFSGWRCDGGDYSLASPGNTFVISGNTTCYAKGNNDPVQIYRNCPGYYSDGAVYETIYPTYGIDMPLLVNPAPTCPNKTFKGYFYQNGTDLKYYNSDLTSANRWTGSGQDFLSAQWGTLSVDYSCAGGDGTAPTDPNNRYLSGESVTALANNSCSITNGYFDKWMCENSLVNVGETITNNITTNQYCIAKYLCNSGYDLVESPLNSYVSIDTNVEAGLSGVGGGGSDENWWTNFNYGRISGVGRCSATAGSVQGETTVANNALSSTSGQYCWCNVTGYTPTGGTLQNIYYLPWVYLGPSNSCADSWCANQCSEYIMGGDNFRANLISYNECVPHINTFTVVYDGNGADSGSDPSSQTCVVGETSCMAASNPYQKAGYRFNGWSCSSSINGNCTNSVYFPSFGIYNATSFDGDIITLSAIWEPLPFRVTYNCTNTDTTIGTGSGSVGSGTAPVDNTNYPVNGTGSATVQSLTSCSATGYTASEWICSDTQGGVSYYEPGNSMQVTDNITCVPAWEETPRCYSVGFDANGGTLNGVSTIYVKNGASTIYSDSNCSTTTSVSIATQTHYSFNGWWTDTGSGNMVYNTSLALQSGVTNYTDAGGNWQLSDNTTLFAQWTPDTYTLTYSCGTGGGTAPTDSNSPYAYNTSVTLLSPTNCGTSAGTFASWSCSVGGTATNYSENGTFNITGDTVCTAQWSQYPLITFDVNAADATLNGTTSPLYLNYTADDANLYTTHTFTSGNVASIPTATRPTYVFTGWWTAPNGGDLVYDGSISPSLQSNVSGYTTASGEWNHETGSHTLYAHWWRNETNILNILYNCGTNATGNPPVDNTQYYPNGDTVTILGNTGICSISNGSFVGWRCSGNAADSGRTYYVNDTITTNDTLQDINCVAEYSCDDNYTGEVSPLLAYTDTVGYVLNDGTHMESVNCTDTSGTWWGSLTNYGMINGTGQCSRTYGDSGQVSYTAPSTESGNYCWCRVTGYTQTGGSAENISYLPWISSGDHCDTSGSNYSCPLNPTAVCAWQCAEVMLAGNNRSVAFSGYACIPELIYLNWLANGGAFNTGESNPGQCRVGAQYNDPEGITPIYAPQRTGYNFTGWLVTGHSN